MKKFIFVFCLILGLSFSAQKKKSDILKSSSISEIENFLKTAHPEDPRRSVLKPKLIALKNSSWMKSGETPSYVVKPLFVQLPKSVLKDRKNKDAEEFQKLLLETEDVHKDKTVKILNQLFTEQVDSSDAILLFQNKSDCNLVLHIDGKDFYNLAVPAKGENSLILKKGDYKLSANVCDTKYISIKTIKKHMMVSLNQPALQVSNDKNMERKGINSF